jgi:hypothetical protein
MDLQDEAVVETAADKEIESQYSKAAEEAEEIEAAESNMEIKREEPAEEVSGRVPIVEQYGPAAAAESTQNPAALPGRVMLPDIVMKHYRQYGLNDEAIKFLYQAQSFEIPASKPVMPPPVRATRKPRG